MSTLCHIPKLGTFIPILGILILATIVLNSGTAKAQSAAAQAGNQTHILVDKSDRRLFVYRGEMGGDYPDREQLVASYHVVIGKIPIGHKQREGDMRTPEGTYRLTKRVCRTCVFKRAFALDYPNARDRREGRTGGAILIHNGVGPFYWWTRGCIALSNADFDELWRLVPDGVAIRIRP